MAETFRPAFPDIEAEHRPYTMLSYGLPFEQACRKHVDGFLGVNHVYIIASKSLAAQTDNIKKLEMALGEKHAGTWLGIPPHTPYASLLPIMDDIRAKCADCVLTIGGGSLADGAKGIAYALANDVHTLDDLVELGEKFRVRTPEQYKGIGNLPKIKLIFLPTTLSGAEYSRYAGLTKPVSNLKIQFNSPGMFASLLVLDPELYKTTPDWVWRSTGVRAIDHCVENICSTRPKAACDVACERGLKELVTALFAYHANPNDMDAKLRAQLGANASMTGLALEVLPGASHGIGHQLGPLGIGHGQTSCILLPAVMKANAPYTQPQQDKIKEILWSEQSIAEVLSQTLKKESCDLGDSLRAIFNYIGMPSTLKEVGIGRDKWEFLEVNSLEDFLVKVNPKPMKTREDIREVLEIVAGDHD